MSSFVGIAGPWGKQRADVYVALPDVWMTKEIPVHFQKVRSHFLSRRVEVCRS